MLNFYIFSYIKIYSDYSFKNKPLKASCSVKFPLMMTAK